ncbi:MAG: sulfotransferase family 2 domain-containing protein [Pseudomonadota bacterium]
MTLVQQTTDMLRWRLAPDRMIDRARPRPDPDLEAVYLRRGLILIHIPKTAGTSVEDALFGHRVRHRDWREIRDLCPRAWGALPKIAVVRDPVERFLSAYDYLRGGGRNATDRGFAAAMIGAQPVTRIVDRLSQRLAYRKRVQSYFHFRPQRQYVCDDTEQLRVDWLIPFSQLAEGLEALAGIAPATLRHANTTRGPRTDRTALPQETLVQIRRLYAGDVTLFDTACTRWAETRPTHRRLPPIAPETPHSAPLKDVAWGTPDDSAIPAPTRASTRAASPAAAR